MHNPIIDLEIKRILASMDNNGSEEPKDTKQLEEKEKPEAFDVYVEEDRITVIKRPEPQPQVIEAVHPPQPQQPPYIAYAAMTISLLFLLYLVTAAFITVFLPPVVTIMIVPKSQTIYLTGTLQLGRLLQPITISQSQTVPTTGKGHQDAKVATGTVTFYNGLFTQQFVAQGTVYTGIDGVQIVTSQDAMIPPGNPTTGYGRVTVTAQAQQSGTSGNITAGDINITIHNGLLVRNNLFHGGQDERNFQTVTKSDITNVATPLKANLAQSVNGALQGQLKTNEALVTPSCTTTTDSNHQPGDEAATVTITVSETCSAVAVNQNVLRAKVTQLLTAQAERKLGTGYSLLDTPQVNVTQAIPARQVTLSFTSVGTWIYALSSAEQKLIKKIIAGKNKQEAIKLLNSLPGIEDVSLQFSGFGDDTRIPKNLSNIILLLCTACSAMFSA